MRQIVAPQPQRNSIHLDWFVQLRWIALIGQLLVFAFGKELLIEPGATAAVIGAVIVFGLSNVALYYIVRREKEFSSQAVASLFVVDTLLLTGLLLVTGGALNPFSILYLIYLAMGAVVLGRRWAYVLAVLSSLGFAALFLFVPKHSMHGHASMSLHLHGMLLAYVIAAFSLAFFLSRVMMIFRANEEKLRKVEILKSSQEKLLALTTLSAGAAHELSSPLAAIKVIAGEIVDITKDEEVKFYRACERKDKHLNKFRQATLCRHFVSW